MTSDEIKTVIAEAKAEVTEFERATRKRRRELASIVRKLERQLAKAAVQETRRRATPERSKYLRDNPEKQAGPTNIAKMRDAFVALGGRATAAEATAHVGSPVGHQVWAIRALEREGFIRETGERIGPSKVYEVATGKRVTRVSPGSSEVA
jgi:hypothetical protein